MRKIVQIKRQYRLNGGDWVDISHYKEIRYQEESECEEINIEITNWKELLRYVEKGKIPTATIEHTLFRKIPYITIYSDSVPADYTTDICEDDFQSLELKRVCVDYSTNFKELMERLDADEFCQYLKDREINLIGVNL